MAFPDTQNRPTSHVVAPADPNAEGANSGMIAGSCFPGIGIATNTPNPKATDWPRAAIDPTPLQPLGWGGDSVVTGQQTADIPAGLIVDYAAADFNDTVAFVQVDATGVGNTAKDEVVAAGYVLASDVPVALALNDWIWAKTAVV